MKKKIKVFRKKPWIIFVGSLLQQNHGESLENHGMLIWNLETRDFEFKQIENDYGFITVDINNGIVNDSALKNIPKNARVRLRINDTTSTQLKDFLIDFRSKHDVEEVSLNRIGSSVQRNEELQKLDLENIRNVDFQNTLIEEYLRINHTVASSIIEKVLIINKQLNSELVPPDSIKNAVWKPKLFEFSNMFSYGENNVVDFSKTDGIVGLFSSNASGKTSLLSALTFCLFDKTSKASKTIDVLNTRKNKFSCKLNFELDGQDYFIEKIGTKKSDKVSVKVNFWRTDSDGNIEDLNGDQRKDTSSVISSYIGSYDDFILTTMLEQNSLINFIDLGQADRKDLLSKFMDLGIFDELEELAKQPFKILESKIKEFEKRDFDEELAVIAGNIPSLKESMESLQQNKSELIEKKDDYSNKMMELAKKIIFIDDNIENIEYLEQNKKKFSDGIDKLDVASTSMLNSAKLKKEQLVEKETSLSEIDVDTIKSHIKKLENTEKEKSKLDVTISELKIHIKHKLEKIEKLGKLEYDPDCKYCMNNIFVKDAITTKESLENDKKKFIELNADLKKVQETIDSLKEYRIAEKRLSDINNEITSMKNEMLRLQTQLSTNFTNVEKAKAELLKIENGIILYHKSKDDILKNEVIEASIHRYKTEISPLNSQILIIDKKILDINSQIVYNNTKKNDIEKQIDEVRELEISHSAYEYYLTAVKRDGIPYDLIKKIVPLIETEVNNILNQIVDFSVLIDLDNKNVNCKIVYDENRIWPLEMASGMEKFISGLSIRAALIGVSNLSRANFIAIDEGFTSLDSENVSGIPMVFNYLRTQFDFVIIISHMESMRDFVDSTLNLKKEDDYSKIEHN